MYRVELSFIDAMMRALANGEHPTRLARAMPARGPIDHDWNLQINASVEPDL